MDGGGAREVEAFASHSNADTVHFGFSWSDGGNHLGVGYFAPMMDSRFCYKEDGVGASWHAGTDTLGNASQIIGKSSDPCVSVGAADEVPIFECLAAGWVDDDVGFFFLMD